MPEEVIRIATEMDLLPLADIYYRVRRETFSWCPSESFQLEDFERDIVDEQLFLFCRDGTPLGFVSVYPPDHFIHHLYVDLPFHRQGIGTKLLAYLNQELDWSWMRLQCLVQNTAAMAFYRRLGWFALERMPGNLGPCWLLEYRRPENSSCTSRVGV